MKGIKKEATKRHTRRTANFARALNKNQGSVGNRRAAKMLRVASDFLPFYILE